MRNGNAHSKERISIYEQVAYDDETGVITIQHDHGVWRIPNCQSFIDLLGLWLERCTDALLKDNRVTWAACRDEWRKEWEVFLLEWLDQNPQLAEEITSQQETFVWKVVEAAGFSKNGLSDGVAKVYANKLAKSQSANTGMSRALAKRERLQAVRPEASTGVVGSHTALAMNLAYEIEAVDGYLRKTFANNLFNGLFQNVHTSNEYHYDDTHVDIELLLQNLPDEEDRKVAILYMKNDSPTQREVARRIGLKSDRQVRNILRRIEETLCRTHPHLKDKAAFNTYKHPRASSESSVLVI